MNNVSNDEKVKKEDNPTFEFAKEFENVDNSSSLLNEFNVQDDKPFDLSSIINSDNSLINDYDKDYSVIMDDVKETEDNEGISLNYNGISGNNEEKTEDNKKDDENKNNNVDENDFDFSILNKNIELLNKLNEESNYFDFMNEDNNQVNFDDTVFNNEDTSNNDNLFNNTDNTDTTSNDSIFNSIKDDSFLLNNEISDDEPFVLDNDNKDATDDFKKDSNPIIDEEIVSNTDESKEQDIEDEQAKKEEVYKKLDEKINELNANTDFTVDETDNLSTDINNLFMKVNSNVQEASDIFNRNVEMKKILDNRFEELKKLQSEIEESRKANYEEINNYKEEVLAKLTAKKEEIEGKLDLLKNLQADFEKEKNEFETYKKDEIVKIETMRKDEESSFETRKVELNRLEEKLRKQKDFLEEEKRQLSLDRIQYETDKNELANNMIKFNEIVGKFTSGIDGIN